MGNTAGKGILSNMGPCWPFLLPLAKSPPLPVSLLYLSLHFLYPHFLSLYSRLYFLPVSPLLTCLNLPLNTLGLAWAPRPLLVSAPAELAP